MFQVWRFSNRHENKDEPVHCLNPQVSTRTTDNVHLIYATGGWWRCDQSEFVYARAVDLKCVDDNFYDKGLCLLETVYDQSRLERISLNPEEICSQWTHTEMQGMENYASVSWW